MRRQDIIYNGRKGILVTSNFQSPQIRFGNFQYIVIPTRDFDSDLSLQHLSNQEVARQRDLIYDSEKGFYIDEDGGLIRDEFGQELG